MKFKNILYVLIFLGVSCIPLIDLFHPGLPVTHDGQDHVARIANFYQNLEEGILVPRWAENLNWGYGHPILMFLYPLPSYLASFLHLLGFSFVDSLKTLFGITFVLSGLSMFLWIKEFLGTEEGFIAGILYMFAPYRFIDLYVRGAIGEHVAFIFPPLVLYCLLKISRKSSAKNIIYATLALAGLVLSHNAISLMFLPIIFLYSFYLWWQKKFPKKFFLDTLVVILLGFGIASFFWIPAFMEGKYTLRDKVTAGEYLTRFVDFKNFLFGQWNYGGSGKFSVQIGIVHWFMVIAGALLYMFKRKDNRVLLLVSFVIFWLTLFIMTPLAMPIWKYTTILQKFQFPWRFLSISVFVASFFGGMFLSTFSAKLKKILLVILVLLVLYFNRTYWYAKDYLIKPENFYAGVYYGTTDTGESAPIWSIRFMEHVPKDTIETISGKAAITKLSRKTTSHSYEIIADEKSRIKENTLYFPGWAVLVDGKQTPIEFQDPQNRGLMTFYLEKGFHSVQIVFRETKLRVLADSISLVSVALLMILFFLSRKKIWKLYR